MNEQNKKEIIAINHWLQNFDVKQIANDPYTLHEIGLKCITYKAFLAEQMAIAKKEWQDQKALAYETYIFSNEANQNRVDKYGTSAIKDYVNSKCGEMESLYLLAERTNNSAGEMSDIIRTVISSLKTLATIT